MPFHALICPFLPFHGRWAATWVLLQLLQACMARTSARERNHVLSRTAAKQLQRTFESANIRISGRFNSGRDERGGRKRRRVPLSLPRRPSLVQAGQHAASHASLGPVSGRSEAGRSETARSNSADGHNSRDLDGALSRIDSASTGAHLYSSEVSKSSTRSAFPTTLPWPSPPHSSFP